MDRRARARLQGATEESPTKNRSKPTVAVSYFHRVYDGGAPEVEFGSPTNSFLVLASTDVKGFHYDANALVNELSEGPVRRAQFGQTLSVSHVLGRKFTLSGEIWHFTQPFLRSNAVGNLWALGYTARKNLVFDTGFNRGLTNTSTRWGGVRELHLFAATPPLVGSTEQQSHPGREAWMACHPSLRTNGRRVKAATGSAHQIPKSALATSPASAIHERYAQSEDSAASARREALES
jgi:hypothetical protein